MNEVPARDEATSAVAVVTGATSGIGFHTAQGLAGRGATVLITGRDAQRGADAVASIAAAAGHQRVAFIQTDHARVEANREVGSLAASQLARLGLSERVDVLVNNVGGIFATRQLTPDGYESTLAVNFLAPYAVTQSMLPMLKASPSARCVNIISSVAWLVRQVDGDLLEDLGSSAGYVGINAHARAKLLTLAWTLALARELADSAITVVAVNPGMAWTSMTSQLTPQVVPAWRYVYPLVRFFQRRADPAKAAEICVRLASTASPAEIAGRYLTEHGKPGKIPGNLADPAFQRRVIDAADRLVQQAPTATM